MNDINAMERELSEKTQMIEKLKRDIEEANQRWLEARGVAFADKWGGRGVIAQLVDRFLAWPLPDSVCSDQCATTKTYPGRTGTTLLTADEVRQMFEYVLQISAAPSPRDAHIESPEDVDRRTMLAESDETWWLIETGNPANPDYLFDILPDDCKWSKDSKQAIRFSRHSDAARVWMGLDLHWARVIEHRFEKRREKHVAEEERLDGDGRRG